MSRSSFTGFRVGGDPSGASSLIRPARTNPARGFPAAQASSFAPHQAPSPSSHPSTIEASTSLASLARLVNGRLALLWNRLNPEDRHDLQRRGWPYSIAVANWHREEIRKGQEPAGSRLEIWLRSARTSGELVLKSRGRHRREQVAISPTDRAMQYRAVFVSSNGDRYPVLDRVEITLQ